jgi:hypothetical protein
VESAEALLPVDCFMSYRSADNDAYREVVDQLKSDLSGRFEAETGRGLKIFVDRDDIGWGEDWRQKIFDSIKRATFLIPIITMRYFESDACREEFMAFYEDARRIGVTDLIMPIVLAGGSRIAPDSPREEMRIVHGLQHVSIEEAFIEGFGSPEWNKTIGRMVQELARAVDKAETKLQDRESRSAQESPAQTQDEVSSAEYADLQDLQGRIADIPEKIDDMERDRNSVMDILNPVLDPSFWQQSPQQQKVKVLAAANALREPAATFAQSTANLEEHVAGIDSGIRLAVDELKSMESQPARELVDALVSAGSRSQEYDEVLAAMPTISDGLKLLGMMNINMRKAVQPVIRGFQSQSLQRVAETFDGWSRFRS